MNNPMNFSSACCQTLEHFNLNSADLCQRSGVSLSRFSNFKTGFNIRVDTLESLLAAMPQEAREYMVLLVARGEQDTPVRE
jgi:predicted transcriptional regulator